MASWRAGVSPGLEQVRSLSPEKKYINQRLNIRMFYSEQLSVKPHELTL